MSGLIAPRPAPPARRFSFSWRSARLRGLVYQALAVAVIGALAWLLVGNTLDNMRLRGIRSGFDFLLQPAGFDIGEGWVAYDSGDPFWKAFLVGVVNTLRVAVVGIALATLLGTMLGVGRFSRNALVRGVCYGYIELFRNVPILLQLLMWYLVFTEYLPAPTEAWNGGGLFFLSKNGLSYPALQWDSGHWGTIGGLVAGCAAAFGYARAAHRRFERTGRPMPVASVAIFLVVAGTWAGWMAGGAPARFDFPELTELQVEGGGAASPEYMAVLLGLVLYTAAFIAELVRAGIAAVALGQHEAAASLGLPRLRAMRLVVLPQALRLVVPPLTSQYLNLTKNSSLAVAVGYPDVVSIANTSLNQTGRAVECIAIIMAVYLTLSLLTSLAMNVINQRVALRER